MAPGHCRLLRREHVLVLYMAKYEAKNVPFSAFYGAPEGIPRSHRSWIEVKTPEISIVLMNFCE